jgi:hypothetical protein
MGGICRSALFNTSGEHALLAAAGPLGGLVDGNVMVDGVLSENSSANALKQLPGNNSLAARPATFDI